MYLELSYLLESMQQDGTYGATRFRSYVGWCYIDLEKFSEEFRKYCAEKKAQGLTWQQISDCLRDEFGIVYNSDNLQRYMRRHNYKELIKGSLTYHDRKSEPSVDDIRDYWDAIIALQEASQNLRTQQTEANISIDTDRPIAVAFWGDWHIGGIGTDHTALLRDRDTIISTDGIYTIQMGDYSDNNLQFGHRGAVYEQVIPPGAQDLLVLDIAKSIKNVALAWVKGNHDDWSDKTNNSDFLQALCSISEAVNLWHGGILYLTVGKITYKIGVKHKPQFESSLNTTNAQRRLNEFFAGCDIVAVADKHYRDLQQKIHMGRNTVWLRSGTYKVLDDFGQRIGGYRGEIGVPIVILHPNTKKIVPFYDLYDGIEYLNYIRGFSNQGVENCGD